MCCCVFEFLFTCFTHLLSQPFSIPHLQPSIHKHCHEVSTAIHYHSHLPLHNTLSVCCSLLLYHFRQLILPSTLLDQILIFLFLTPSTQHRQTYTKSSSTTHKPFPLGPSPHIFVTGLTLAWLPPSSLAILPSQTLSLHTSSFNTELYLLHLPPLKMYSRSELQRKAEKKARVAQQLAEAKLGAEARAKRAENSGSVSPQTHNRTKLPFPEIC